MKKEIEGGWFSISVGLKMLLEENLTLEEIKEKVNRIADYLMSEHENEKGLLTMICQSCDGDGYLVFGNGKTKECIRCDGTGRTIQRRCENG